MVSIWVDLKLTCPSNSFNPLNHIQCIYSKKSFTFITLISCLFNIVEHMISTVPFRYSLFSSIKLFGLWFFVKKKKFTFSVNAIFNRLFISHTSNRYSTFFYSKKSYWIIFVCRVHHENTRKEVGYHTHALHFKVIEKSELS